MADKNNVDIDEPNNFQSGEQVSDSSVADKPKRSVGRIILRVVIIVLIALVIVCVCGFSIYRWLWGNDVRDIQGRWYVEGTDRSVDITENYIVLNDEVSYFYVIDSESKTITYTLGDLEGSGFYRFSVDRSQIAIMDGTFNWWTTLISDIPWTVEAFMDFIGGKDKSPAGENNVTLLSRSGLTLSTSDSSDEAKTDVQDENPEETAVPENEDTEGGSDFEDSADRGEDDSSESTADQNDQPDQEAQNGQGDADSSNDKDSNDDFDMFGMYDI